jgi:hypothetical protein
VHRRIVHVPAVRLPYLQRTAAKGQGGMTGARLTPFDRYARHARAFGACDEFWQAAASDLNDGQLRRLAADLGVKLPGKWANTRNRAADPAPEAGLTANNSGGPSDGLRSAVSSAERPRNCRDCGRALGSMNTSGLCRTCYQRELMRRRRAQDNTP